MSKSPLTSQQLRQRPRKQTGGAQGSSEGPRLQVSPPRDERRRRRRQRRTFLSIEFWVQNWVKKEGNLRLP